MRRKNSLRPARQRRSGRSDAFTGWPIEGNTHRRCAMVEMLSSRAAMQSAQTKRSISRLGHVRPDPSLSHGWPSPGSRAAVGVSWRPCFGGQWLQQRWIRGSFDPDQVPRLRFTGVAVWYGIQVSQPPRRNRVAVVLPHRPFDELPGGLGRSPTYGRFARLHLVQRGEVERAARDHVQHVILRPPFGAATQARAPNGGGQGRDTRASVSGREPSFRRVRRHERQRPSL